MTPKNDHRRNRFKLEEAWYQTTIYAPRTVSYQTGTILNHARNHAESVTKTMIYAKCPIQEPP